MNSGKTTAKKNQQSSPKFIEISNTHMSVRSTLSQKSMCFLHALRSSLKHANAIAVLLITPGDPCMARQTKLAREDFGGESSDSIFFVFLNAKMQDGEYPDHLLWNPHSQAWEVRLGSQLVKDHQTENSSPRASEELGIVYRGEGELTDGQTWIELPSTSSHFTVSLTQILRGGNNQFARLMASPVAGGGFTVYGDPCTFAWHAFGPKKA